MTHENFDTIRHAVRERCGQIAQTGTAGCDCAPTSCCDISDATTPEATALSLGYSSDDVSTVPAGANGVF